MRQALAAFFNVFTAVITKTESVIITSLDAVEHTAGAVNVYAEWAEDESKAFAEESRVERKARLDILQQRMDKQVAAELDTTPHAQAA